MDQSNIIYEFELISNGEPTIHVSDGPQAFFIETVVSGEEATDAALTTASTQAGVTTDRGTTLFEAFSPMLADIDDETNQGNLFQTAAGPTATGPIGFGTGAGGGGGGGAAASNN